MVRGTKCNMVAPSNPLDPPQGTTVQLGWPLKIFLTFEGGLHKEIHMFEGGRIFFTKFVYVVFVWILQLNVGTPIQTSIKDLWLVDCGRQTVSLWLAAGARQPDRPCDWLLVADRQSVLVIGCLWQAGSQSVWLAAGGRQSGIPCDWLVVAGHMQCDWLKMAGR